MPENLHSSSLIGIFVILIIVLFAFISLVLQGPAYTNSSGVISFSNILIFISPGIIFFLFMYRKMNNKGINNLECPRCNFKNEEGDIFCLNCGLKL